MGDGETNDDFYESYEEYLDDDQISPEEEGFMKGFTAKAAESEPEEDIEVEMEDIDLEFEWDEAPGEEGSEGMEVVA
ncbi:hypothetical protein HYU40_04960 [Candidatus Woesearchaeota archaeon]|nr:hypothetical protein [Candidatus Woesearchaeota archaeon]